jgi:DHA1 family tetracycline resistance protein-like MFS transporter
MAALGLSTMLSEAVLVRVAIPAMGEKRAMRVGLASFAMQCVLLAVADSPWHLFACAALAIPGNLVYPSVSSLVSATVKPDMVGRALGAVNGVKSLTEGVGPLVFGTLLTMSEKDNLPGWPYFIAAVMAAMAFHAGGALPNADQEDGMYKSGMDYKYNIDLREEDAEVNLLDRDVSRNIRNKR